MYKFLSKFLSQEQLTQVVEAYKASNPKESELPVYVSKARLDEVLAERDDYKTKYKAIPQNWQEQIAEAKKLYDDEVAAHTQTKTDYEAKLTSAKKDAEIDSKLYLAKAKNITAVKALIDNTKPIDDEIKRLQKDESYLFGLDKMPYGTGKNGNSDSDEPDGELGEEKMRAALGLPTKTN